MPDSSMSVSELIVQCLEAEGVKYVFGIPGEENIHLVRAIHRSDKIRFILTRHEQAASFMADSYGRLTGRAGVCLATLGPGAINLLLGTANAQLDSHPLVALAAQAGLNRLYKETHQAIDLVELFQAVTKFTEMPKLADTVPEIVRKAFKVAQSERWGASCVIIPEDLAVATTSTQPLAINEPFNPAPPVEKIDQAIHLIEAAQNPIILAGHGVSRDRASESLRTFAKQLNIPVATTFLGKGVMSDRDPLCLGALGFMVHDYTNFGFDNADLVITVGYDLVEYSPTRWNPHQDKQILHISRLIAEVDSGYQVTAGIEGSISKTLQAIAAKAKPHSGPTTLSALIRNLHHEELTSKTTDPSFPLKPQRIVADIRAVLDDDDIVLCDTGALKMWMARLYPTYQPETCLISNGLATMAFALPGAIGAKLARPEAKVLATMGDGAYLMNAQEIETALRENIPLVALIWVDQNYGLIKWKMELEMGESCEIAFQNPDFVKHAESFGAKGYKIERADDLRPTLEKALADSTVSIIACPVDYSENETLTNKLGDLTEAL